MLAFYADESGSFSIRDPHQPWVVLLAVWFDDDHWLSIDDAMTRLKSRYFAVRDPSVVEIRSNDLRTAHVASRNRNPFSLLEPSMLRSFGDDLYATIDLLPFHWSAAVIHKPTATRQRLLQNSHDLFALSYTMLLERLDRWCAVTRTPARLFVDQRDGTLLGRTHRKIVDVHDRYRINSAAFDFPRVVERPYFHDSSRSNHIQLAGIIAYNVLRRFRDGDPHYSYFKRVAPKLRRFSSPADDGLALYRPAEPIE